MGRHFKAKIISNLHLNSRNSLLTIRPLEPVDDPKPGQFYLLKVINTYDPLLKRPFSFFRKTSEGIQFLYTVRGKGTSIMRELAQGDVISILGPLGSGYPVPRRGELPLLVAGGIGIASIFSFAESLGTKARVFYGTRDKNELIMLDELNMLTDKLIISTEDGSMGAEGMIVDVLEDFLTGSSGIKDYVLYACGPKPMLEAIARITGERGLRCYVSMEENMACGVGACQGCAIKVRSKEKRAKSREERAKSAEFELIYKMVCKDGPVFPIEKIVW